MEYTRCKIKTRESVVIPPCSEQVLNVKVQSKMPIGATGVCYGSRAVDQKGLFLARSVGCVNSNKRVVVKLLNPSDSAITLRKGFSVGYFELLDGESLVTRLSDNPGEIGCANIEEQDEDYNKFMGYFDWSTSRFTEKEREEFGRMLFKHREVFVTDEHPQLGYTTIATHKIHLKPNSQMYRQRPYRLAPEKKKALHDVLQNLYEQGVIAPVSDSEDLPITSPIVLVSKPKAHTSATNGSKETSVAQWRFTVDYRQLNQMTQDFNYKVPDLQELVESFSDIRFRIRKITKI